MLLGTRRVERVRFVPHTTGYDGREDERRSNEDSHFPVGYRSETNERITRRLRFRHLPAHREGEGDAGTLSKCALDAHIAAVECDHALNDRQSKT